MVFPGNTNRLYDYGIECLCCRCEISGFWVQLAGVSFILSYAKFGLVLSYGTRLRFPFRAFSLNKFRMIFIYRGAMGKNCVTTDPILVDDNPKHQLRAYRR